MNTTQFVMAYAVIILSLSINLVYAQQLSESAITQLYSVTQLCSGNGDGQYSPPTNYQGLPGKKGSKGDKGDSSTYVENEEQNRRFSNKLVALHGQLTSVQSNIQTLEGNFDKTQAALTASNARIQTLEADLDKTQAALSASNEKITGMEEQMKMIMSNRLKFCSILQRPSMIDDNQITASTYWRNDAGHAPRQGRLFSTSGVGSWCAASNRANEWIQVDLEEQKIVYGVVTQGRGVTDHQWVTSYSVSYKTDIGGNFRNVDNESGAVVVFQGNIDQDTPVTNDFRQPIHARYFRINILTWYHHISLRFDLMAC